MMDRSRNLQGYLKIRVRARCVTKVLSLFLVLLSASQPLASQSPVPLNPDRGVCLIWYGSQDNLNDRGGVVTGGQVMMMWRDFEPSRGAYNFGPSTGHWPLPPPGA